MESNLRNKFAMSLIAMLPICLRSRACGEAIYELADLVTLQILISTSAL